MRTIMGASYVENGELHYIVALTKNAALDGDDQPTLDGTEIIVNDGTIYPATGGVGIPAMNDTNFYTVYSIPTI